MCFWRDVIPVSEYASGWRSVKTHLSFYNTVFLPNGNFWLKVLEFSHFNILCPVLKKVFFFFFFLDYKLGKVQMSQSESWFEKITENKDNSCFLFDGASRLKSI